MNNNNIKITQVFNKATFMLLGKHKNPKYQSVIDGNNYNFKYVFNAEVRITYHIDSTINNTIDKELLYPMYANMYLNEDGSAGVYTYMDCTDLSDEQMQLINTSIFTYKATVKSIFEPAILDYIYCNNPYMIALIDKYKLPNAVTIDAVEYVRNGNKFDTTYVVECNNNNNNNNIKLNQFITPCDNIKLRIPIESEEKVYEYQYRINLIKPTTIEDILNDIIENATLSDKEEYIIYSALSRLETS